MNNHKKMSKKKNSQVGASATLSINPVTGLSDDSNLIMVYEKRIAEMMMTMQKQERDILYKDEELKSIKNIARDVAE